MSRVVLISGGASGIGAALATAHVMAGDTVVVADLHPRDPSHVLLDVRDREAFARVARDVAEQHGRIDLFYDNAGIGVAGGIEELDPRPTGTARSTSTCAAWSTGSRPSTRSCGPRSTGTSCITASLAGLIPVPLLGPYTVTKHAVVALARVLRLEAAASGVKVTAVCPAFVDAPLLDNIIPGLPAYQGQPGRGRPVRRVQGTADQPGAGRHHRARRAARNPETIVVPKVLGRLGRWRSAWPPASCAACSALRGRPLPAPGSGGP